jgi:hypothetical protein
LDSWSDIVTTLEQSQHIAVIREFGSRANTEFETGNEFIAAEILWGAFAHGLIVVATLNQWRYTSHESLKHVARNLAQTQSLPRWQSDFAYAERLHIHFYHGHLGPLGLAQARTATRLAIGRLLDLFENEHR